MTISKELLDDLLKGCERPEDLFGDAGLLKELKIRLMERMLGAELTAHLGYEEGKNAPLGQSNRRNGSASKRLKGQDGEVPISAPRDRDGSFEPELVKKGQTRSDGMDDIDEDQETVRGAVCPRRHRALCCWFDGPLHPYPSRGCLWPSILARPDQPRHRRGSRRGPGMAIPSAGADVSDRHFRRSAGQNPRCGQPHGQEQGSLCGLGHFTGRCPRGSGALGLWIAENEGAEFWLSVMSELKNCGVQDILIAVVDGLKPPAAYAAPQGPRSAYDPGGDHRRLPGRHGPDLYRASG